MKFVTWNVNGIRAASDSGLLEFLENTDADFVCLQEVKANLNQLPWMLRQPAGYELFINSAEKKGYAGTAIYYKHTPLLKTVEVGINRFDSEGRFIRFDFEDFILINVYIPHGGRLKENLDYKLAVYRQLNEYLKNISNKNVIFVGDLNIAHTEKDLSRPEQNKDNIMFTPEERSQLDKLVEIGYKDVFRMFDDSNDKFSWWSYAFNSRENNIGWRLDYLFVSPPLISKCVGSEILKDIKGSDHCPVVAEIEFF